MLHRTGIFTLNICLKCMLLFVGQYTIPIECEFGDLTFAFPAQDEEFARSVEVANGRLSSGDQINHLVGWVKKRDENTGPILRTHGKNEGFKF